MTIPETLFTKTKEGRFQGRVERILDEGWNYLRSYFKDENEYFDFLKNLTEDQYNKFLYTIFFYWAHDLYRLIRKELRDPNIDGFMYQLTLSVVEYLNKSISEFSRKRIENFFTKYFSAIEQAKLKRGITVRSLGDNPPPKIESWEILYDMRNEFIHRAAWFSMRIGGGFASLVVVRRKNGEEYLLDIRINFADYLELFWTAYLKYFGKT